MISMNKSAIYVHFLALPILCGLALGAPTASWAEEGEPSPPLPNLKELTTAVKLFQKEEDPASMSRYVRALRTQEADLSWCGSLPSAMNSSALEKIYSNTGIGRASDAIYYTIKIDIALKRLGIPKGVYADELAEFRELAQNLLSNKDLGFSKHLAPWIIDDEATGASLSAEDALEISRYKSSRDKVNARFGKILDSITNDVNAYTSKHRLGLLLVSGDCGGGPPFFRLTVEFQPPNQAKFFYINSLQWRLCGVRGINPWDKARCEGWLLGSARENPLRYGQYYLLGIWTETSTIAKEKIMLQSDTHILLLPDSKANGLPR
jgi:hypothetical protein